MNRLGLKLATMQRLGWINVARVAAYRTGIKLGLHPVQNTSSEVPQQPFFGVTQLPPFTQLSSPSALLAFGTKAVSLKGPLPLWNSNVLTGVASGENEGPWWKYSDFDPAVGDIKLLWEVSRMAWAPLLALAFRNGDRNAGQQLNNWLEDWLKHNPPYNGRQWKCGQEASLRVLNLCVAALILGQESSAERSIVDLVELHLKRIAPTVAYAKGQDNNHGTSEAAALFVGGLFLSSNGNAAGRQYCRVGREMLEERVNRLFNRAGGFSQYSMTYHRMALDTLSLAEAFRLAFGAEPFQARFMQTADKAAHWLFDRVEHRSGDAPNWGANDGANILCAPGSDYRDFRPSVQLAMALFAGARAFDAGPWNSALAVLRVHLPDRKAQLPQSTLDVDGGTAMLRVARAMAFLRLPGFAFRPSHADVLHLDFWLDGNNLLRDGGTFSYNTDAKTYTYFRGVESHNTVQFDDHDQMPSLGRFLYGAWISGSHSSSIQQIAATEHVEGAYTDQWGARHKRKMVLTTGQLVIDDDVSGFQQKACLRWRLAPGVWDFHGVADNEVEIRFKPHPALSLNVRSESKIAAQLTQGYESRYYMQKHALPVLEVQLTAAAKLTTTLVWKP